MQDGRFAEALSAHVGDWIADGETRILLSGMIGSRQGWVEAPYVSCPARIADLADAVIEAPFPDAEVLLVPGVIAADSCGVPEVMRGEETEAMGISDTCGGAGLICLPGTHCKWIQLRDGAIASFETFMTGEVFAALRTCTILGRTMERTVGRTMGRTVSRTLASDAPLDSEAFLRGVARSADLGGLLHHLFSVRTLGLTGRLSEEASASYLSGLLIGHEVRSAMPEKRQVYLAGSAALCSPYTQAIEACGGSFTLDQGDVAARGLAAIGRRLSWI